MTPQRGNEPVRGKRFSNLARDSVRSPKPYSLARLAIPELDGVVEPCACNQSTVGTECHMVDLLLMSSKTSDGFLDAVTCVIEVLR